MVIGRKQGKRGGSKKVKMAQVEFDLKAIKEIKKRRKRLKKSKPLTLQDLDERYLGQRLPGTPLQRAKLLDTLQEMLEEEGEHWVQLNREVLLKEAELLVDSGISF
jgi:hypothetical protein